MSCPSDREAPWPTARAPRVPRVVGMLLLTSFLVLGTFGASHAQPWRRPVDAVAVALVLAGPVALVALRRRPQLAVTGVGALTLAYLGAGYAYGPAVITLVVAVIVAVAGGHRTTAWLTVAAVVVGDFAVHWLVLGEPRSWAELLGVTAWALVALAVAELVRTRRERATSWRQAREEARRRQVGEERLQIAQELHDVVAHHMSLINVQASVALHLAEKQSAPVEPALLAIKDASKQALSEMRALVGVLRDGSDPAPRSPLATLDALDELVERSRHAGLDVRCHVAGEQRPLPATVELAAFRIVQEAVTNVVRHANATTADVTLTFSDDGLDLRVSDDGRGGPHAEVLPGNGLLGMRERAEALGGHLDVGRTPAGGVVVRATLPIPGPEATTR
ncbi:MAG: sensor histidine kinase [Angustibacter sp.]